MAMVPTSDNTWLIDMMVSIMHASTWNEPLTAFINEKCIMFDNFEEENRHDYMLVHQEFKSLVDNLLAAHLLEVDISPEEFEKQCIESGLVEDPRLQQVVGQLMAAEDFMTFKQMMIERHCGMQQQAESNYKDVAASEDVAAAEAAAIAASIAEAEAAARAAAGVPGAPPAPPGGAAPAPTSPGGTVKPPTMAQERAFGAGGGFYGRATMGANKTPPTKEKADAIRKALCGALRPR